MIVEKGESISEYGESPEYPIVLRGKFGSAFTFSYSSEALTIETPTIKTKRLKLGSEKSEEYFLLADTAVEEIPSDDLALNCS